MHIFRNLFYSYVSIGSLWVHIFLIPCIGIFQWSICIFLGPFCLYAHCRDVHMYTYLLWKHRNLTFYQIFCTITIQAVCFTWDSKNTIRLALLKKSLLIWSFRLVLAKFSATSLRFVSDLGEFWSNSVQFAPLLQFSHYWSFVLLRFNIDDITSMYVCI